MACQTEALDLRSDVQKYLMIYNMPNATQLYTLEGITQADVQEYFQGVQHMRDIFYYAYIGKYPKKEYPRCLESAISAPCLSRIKTYPIILRYFDDYILHNTVEIERDPINSQIAPLTQIQQIVCYVQLYIQKKLEELNRLQEDYYKRKQYQKIRTQNYQRIIMEALQSLVTEKMIVNNDSTLKITEQDLTNLKQVLNQLQVDDFGITPLPLYKIGVQDQYRFADQSVNIYLYLRKLIQNLLDFQPGISDKNSLILSNFHITTASHRMMLSMFKQYYYNTALNEHFKHEDIKLKLFDILLLSKACNDYEQAATNAFTLLNLVGVSFANMDLSNIKVNQADLQGGNFQGTNFSGAQLLNVNFANACLDRATFKSANLSNCNFGVNYPLLSGFAGSVTKLALLEQSHQLLAATSEK